MKNNLEEILKNITKRYGEGTIMNIGEKIDDVEVISTSSINLDRAIGVPGVPKARITELYGSEGGGKTSICAHVVAEAQKKGEMCVYIDSEHAVDLKNFEDLGVDIHNNFMLSQPDSGEQALGIVEMLLNPDSNIGVIVVDSVAALVPEAELAGDIEDSTIGLLARLMSKFMRRVTPLMSKSNTALIFINQIRSNIGGYGNSPANTTPGGKALKFAASLRIEISRTGSIKDGDKIIGQTIKAKVVKNKVGSPFTEANFDFIYGSGISSEREILELGNKAGIISKGGAWISYTSDTGEAYKWQGLEKARLYIKDNPELKEELLNKLKDVK